jgi:hypothetical protein
MTEEERLKQAIAEGKDADQWLNHPAFKHVLTLLRAEYFILFEKTKFDQKEIRDEIWRKMQALTAIVNDMERIINDGTRAEVSLGERIKNKIRTIM